MHAPGGTQRWQLRHGDLSRLADAARRILAAEATVVAAYLYGSAARGERAADLDVALLLSAPLPSLPLDAIAASLQAEGAPAGAPIDLRPLWGTGARFQINVLRDGKLLFERDRDARLAAEAAIMSRWADFKPTWERMRQRARERWVDG